MVPTTFRNVRSEFQRADRQANANLGPKQMRARTLAIWGAVVLLLSIGLVLGGVHVSLTDAVLTLPGECPDADFACTRAFAGTRSGHPFEST